MSNYQERFFSKVANLCQRSKHYGEALTEVVQPFVILFIISTLLCACSSTTVDKTPQVAEVRLMNSPEIQDSIIQEHVHEGAKKLGLYSLERQQELDKGLAKDSTIAYLWQQKAMPLYKQGKYELGLEYLDKAVRYNPERWQDYRAFMKCIFAKTYRASIIDFEDCRRKYGNNVVMDHSYNFYIAVCKLQLNEFDEAEKLLVQEVENQAKENGEEWVHHLDLFYLGITQYEQRKLEEALATFDRALEKYATFSEALQFKAATLGRLGKMEEANRIAELARSYGKKGYSFNEDNQAYERYPYQIRW
ncbi:MAG: tetratricopeptide repeat protein [Bacteroidia bacterium]